MASVRTRPIFSDARLAVTAVESMEFQSEQWGRSRFVTGSLRPIAIIVRDQGRTYALDMAAQPVDIDELNLSASFDSE